MNHAQNIAHFRLWNDVCRHLGWRMERGRLVAAGAAPGIFAARVWAQAWAVAWADARAATVADLRHALYFLATGQVTSKRIRTNPECTRVIGWLLLCLDDTSLIGAEKAGLSGRSVDEQARANRIAWLRSQYRPDYLESICRDRFAGRYEPPHWDGLGARDIKALYVLLRSRQPKRPSPNSETQKEDGEIPF